MGGKKAKQSVKKTNNFKLWLKNRSLFQKIGIGLMLTVFMLFLVMFSTAQWYIWSNRNKPLTVGATFIPNYARYFDLDPQETFKAMIDELGIRQFRLVSYWKDIEKTEGTYDFSELDWQFEMAEKYGANISLSIGLRQPRWPECHMPTWAMDMSMQQWEPKLLNVMKATIERYKDSPSLKSYQLENEFLMTVFGECPDHSRDRLVREFEFVKSLDKEHPVIISRSNNAIGLPLGDPRPDMFAVSIYKRVWDKSITKRYIEYPFPAWFYASLAGGGKIFTGKDMIIHELQTEAWLT
jgi:hypothetical protein